MSDHPRADLFSAADYIEKNLVEKNPGLHVMRYHVVKMAATEMVRNLRWEAENFNASGLYGFGDRVDQRRDAEDRDRVARLELEASARYHGHATKSREVGR